MGEVVLALKALVSTIKALMSAMKALIAVFSLIVTITYDTWKNIDAAARSVTTGLGMMNEQAQNYAKTLTELQKDFALKFNMTAKDIAEFQQSYIDATHKVILATEKELESFAALTRLGVGDAMKTMIIEGDRFGMSMKTASGFLGIARVNAQKLGLDVKETSKRLADNMKNMSKFGFKDGVNDIMKMTTLSETLRFNFQDIAGAVDKFSNIDSAIQTTANLQVLGGTIGQSFSNPLDALNEALTDTMGLTNRIVDSVSSMATFDKATGLATINSPIERMRLNAAAGALGISYDQLANMAQSQVINKQLDESMGNNINRFSATQMDAIHNMARYDVEKQAFTINAIGKDGNMHDYNVNELTPEKLAEIMPYAQTDNIDTNVSNISQNISKIERILSRSATQNMAGPDLIEGAKNSFTTYFMQEMKMNDVYNTAFDSLRSIASGDKPLNGDTISQAIADTTKSMSEAAKASITLAGKLASQGLGIVTDVLSNLKTIVDEWWDKAWFNMKEYFNQTWNSIKGFFGFGSDDTATTTQEPEQKAIGGVVAGDNFAGDLQHIRVNAGELIMPQNRATALLQDIAWSQETNEEFKQQRNYAVMATNEISKALNTFVTNNSAKAMNNNIDLDTRAIETSARPQQTYAESNNWNNYISNNNSNDGNHIETSIRETYENIYRNLNGGDNSNVINTFGADNGVTPILSMNEQPTVVSQPTVGSQPTIISEVSSAQSSAPSTLKMDDVNVHMDGTIRIETNSPNQNAQDININELFKNTEFQRLFSDALKNAMATLRSSGGKKDYGSSIYQLGYES